MDLSFSKSRARMAFAALAALILALLAVRIRQIYSYTTNDFDTSSILLGVQGGFYDGYRAFFDVAHPGLLSLWVFIGHAMVQAAGFPPIHYWGTLLCVALGVSLPILYAAAIRLGASRRMAAMACVLYLSSPAISDISARSEENILLHPVFLLAILVLTSYLQRPTRCRLYAVGAASVLVAAEHLQPFLIVCGGLSLYALAAGLGTSERGHLLERVKLAAVFALPGIGYYFILRLFFRQEATNYATTYYSIFNNDSTREYLKAFFLFFQGYFVTGTMPFSWSANGVVPTSPLYLLGVLAASLMVPLLLIHRRLVDCIALAALGFAFLYEPSSSERWDTFVIAAIPAIATVSLASARLPRLLRHHGAVLICLVLLLCNVSAVESQMADTSAGNVAKSDAAKYLQGRAEVFADLNDARAVIGRLPSGVRVRNISISRPTEDSVVFSSQSAADSAKRLGITCLPTESQNFCVVSD